MRKWITLLMTLLVGCGTYANANTGQVSFEAGYRRDNISWKHRFPADDPFVASNTRFKDIDIFQIGLQGRTTVGYNFYVRGNAYWGWILDGDFERNVSTYFSPYYSESGDDNLKFGFSDGRSSIIDDKYVYGVGGAIGYPFYFCDCTMILAPVIGYAYDEQNVRVDDEGFNFEQSNGRICPTSEVTHRCCRQTFISRWYGPFFGFDFNYRPWNECWNLYADVEYHWGSFRGKRSHGDGFDFHDHHNHSSRRATGWVFAAGADYDLSNCWTVGFSVKFQDWTANRHHRDRGDYDSDSQYLGSGHHHMRTNHKWHSWAANLTFGRDF